MSKVYFMQHGQDDLFKIGVSSDVDARLEQINNHELKPIKLIGYIDGLTSQQALALEKFLHVYFARNYVKREWFEMNLSALLGGLSQVLLLVNQWSTQVKYVECNQSASNVSHNRQVYHVEPIRLSGVTSNKDYQCPVCMKVMTKSGWSRHQTTRCITDYLLTNDES